MNPNPNRRTFLKTMSALTAAGVSTPWLASRAFADSAEFTLKYGNYQPMAHPNNVHAAIMAQKIKEESKGRIDFQVYPDSQLGSDVDMLSQLRIGALDFMSLGPVTLGTLQNIQQLSAIGFALKDYDHVWAAMDGDLGAMVRDQLKKGTSIFAFEKIWDNGFRQMTSSAKPIQTPADLAGMKVRVPPTPILTSMFQSLKAAPTTISMHDVYMSLQTHVVDAQENPMVLISASKLYEVQKYCSMTNHVWDGFWMLGNQKKFATLPADLQEIVTRNVNEAAIGQRADTARLNTSLIDTLKKQGLVFNDVDPMPFRQQLQASGFYANWKKRFGDSAWALLERYSGKIA